jgi:hypothetical protein
MKATLTPWLSTSLTHKLLSSRIVIGSSAIEDDDWEDWSDVIFGGDELIDLPATVDHTCVVFVY